MSNSYITLEPGMVFTAPHMLFYRSRTTNPNEIMLHRATVESGSFFIVSVQETATIPCCLVIGSAGLGWANVSTHRKIICKPASKR